MIFSNKLDAVLYALDESAQSDLDIQRLTGVTRTQVFRWRQGAIKDVQTKTFKKVMDALSISYKFSAKGIELNTEKTHNEDNTLGGREMTNKIIMQQGNYIEYLENQLKASIPVQKQQGAVDFKSVGRTYVEDNVSKEDYENQRDVHHENNKWITTGDVSMLGYTLKEWNKFTPRENMMRLHPESLQETMKIKDLLKKNNKLLVHLKGIRMMKSKAGKYVNMMVEYYFTKEKQSDKYWNSTLYFTHISSNQEAS